MIAKSMIVIISLVVFWFTFRLIFSLLSVNETASYHIISQQQPFEIRDYDDMIVAMKEGSRDRQKAISKAFPSLLRYISGQNQTQKKIAMTTPVLQQQSADGWWISFIMPRAYDLQDLPAPLDKTIHLQVVQPTRYICSRFSGMISHDNLNKQLSKLNHYVQANQIQVIGKPIYAFYNPPWTLPFLRRNEIWYLVARSDKANDDQHHVFEVNKDHQKTHH